MSAQRIFVVPRWYPSLQTPVIGTFVAEQVMGMARTYSEDLWGVSTYSRADMALQTRLGMNNMQVLTRFFRHLGTRILYPAQNVMHLDTPTLHWNPRLLEGNRKAIERVHERHFLRFRSRHGQPRVIHAHSASAAVEVLALKEKYGVPLVITEHDLQIHGTLLPVLKRADCVIAVSAAQARFLSDAGVQNIKVVLNAVDAAHFPLRSHPPGGPLTIATLSRIDHRKGIDDLLRAFARIHHKLPEATRLLIGGEGPSLKAMKSLAHQLGVGAHVIWEGSVSRERVPHFLARSHFFVSASHVESFGLVLAEALAMGIPVITSDSGGPTDFVHAANGLIFPVSDVRRLSELLLHMTQRYATYKPPELRSDILSLCRTSKIYPQIQAVYQGVFSRCNA